MPNHRGRAVQRKLASFRARITRAGRSRTFRPTADALEGRQLLAVAIAEIPAPGVGTAGFPAAMIAGPDGNLWFDDGGNAIGQLTASGVVTRFPVGSDNGSLVGAMTFGSDGNLWFTNNPEPIASVFGNVPAEPPLQIDRMTSAGLVTKFTVLTQTSLSGSYSLTAGADGNLWFTVDNDIDRITPTGTVTSFPLPNNLVPESVITRPDENLWFTCTTGQIGMMTTSGVITMLPGVLTGAPQGGIGTMANGPDGSLWVLVHNTEPNAPSESLDRVAPDGTVAGVSMLGVLASVAVGSDGTVWIGRSVGDNVALNRADIVRYNPSVSTTVLVPPTQGSPLSQVAVGPDGNLWFVEEYADRIGQVDLNAPMPAPLTASPKTISATATVPFSGAVATFTPLNSNDTFADYTANIQWGDGATSTGTITADGQGNFIVSGGHTYSGMGSENVIVTITDIELGTPGATATVRGTASVAQMPLTPISQTVQTYRGNTAPLLVAQATSATLSSNYTATIDWGDGTTSTGGVGVVFLAMPPGGQGLLPGYTVDVYGEHAYAKDGSYIIHTTINDGSGTTTTVVSSATSVTAAVEGVEADALSPRAGVAIGTHFPPFPGVSPETQVAHFVINTAMFDTSGMSATVNWGDGSAPSSAYVLTGSTPGVVTTATETPISVVGAHTYTKVGTYSFTITVNTAGSALDVPGGSFVIHGQAIVTPGAASFSGSLDPASDTGYSDRDGVTAVQTPYFNGTATAGSTLEFLAERGSGSAPIVIGRRTVGASGQWSVRSSALPQGTYTIVVNQTTPDGISHNGLTVKTGSAAGRIVIDTGGPTVTGAALNPRAGEITLKFTDNLSQVNPLGLLTAPAVRLVLVTPKGSVNVPVRVQALTPGGGGAVLSVGHAVPNGRYVLQLAAGSVRDAAGNALDGEFSTRLPSGDGTPGGNFVALFHARGSAVVQAQPVPIAPLGETAATSLKTRSQWSSS